MKILPCVKKISESENEYKKIKSFLMNNPSLINKLPSFIIINSTANGRKKVIYCEKNGSDILFPHLSYQYYNEFTMDKIDKCNLHKVKYDSENELEDKLLRYSILSKAINSDNIFIIHEYFGWQQVFNSYIYRNLSSITNKLQSYEIESGDYCFEFNKDINSDCLLRDYNELIKTINLLPHNFTLPLLAYHIFSYTKSLYKQYGHKFDISKNDNYFALNVIPTQDVNINNFLIEFVKEFSLFTIKEKIFNPIEYGSEIGTLNKPVCSDFPVFTYNSEIQNLEAKTSIPSSMFHKAVTSNISYIYYNIKNFEDYLIRLSVPKDIELPSHDKNIQAKFSQTLLGDYLYFVSKTLSYETYKKEKTRKEKLLKRIYMGNQKENNQIPEYIGKFLINIYNILENKKISASEYFFRLLKKETDNFTIKEFEALEKEYKDKNIMLLNEITKFAQKYYDKHLLKYESEFKNEKYECQNNCNVTFLNNNFCIVDKTSAIIDKKINEELFIIGAKMHERYIEMLVNSCISISKHHPTYFDNLHKKAKKYLKDNLKGKKYDRVQASHCSFLLAAMMSFRDYIDNRLPEVSEDFNKYFQEFNNIILQMCCTPFYKNIDNATALSEFTSFLTLQIEDGSIIDKNLGIDSEIGWIDREKNKIYLKNASDNNFYDKFTKYLTDRHEDFDLSKQAFVRDVLAANKIIRARTTSKNTKVQRYDYERKIVEGHDKFRVLVLNCKLLKTK